jgi:Tfp pilus assembly protein PilV
VKPAPLAEHPGSRRPARGFTIAEVMFAAAVMALAITTAITTMQSAFLALDSARNITLAGQIMQSELERMRLKDWPTVSGYPAGPSALTIDTSFTGSATINERFTLSRSVAEVHADMKQITMTIVWRGYDGREQSRSYTTYYGKNGLYDFFYNSY